MNQLKKIFLVGAVALTVGAAQAKVKEPLVSPPVNTIDSLTFSDSFDLATSVATFGQTFSFVAAQTMKSFSLYLSNVATGAVDFKGYVYDWNPGVNSKTGTKALYTSGLRHFSGTEPQELIFDTGTLSLDANQTYVVFLSTLNNAVAPYGSAKLVAGHSYAGGNFVYTANDTFSKLNSAAWTVTNDDIAFNVNTSAVPVAPLATGNVPEPGSIALFGFALAGLAMVRRRKRA